MTIDKSTIKELDTTQEALELLRKDLMEFLPDEEFGPGEKLKRSIAIWREILRHRIIDLADASITLFRQERIAPACTLARSCFETIAHLYYFKGKLKKASSAKDIQKVQDLVAKGIFGSRDNSSEIAAIQVLKSIDDINKEFKGFRGEYENLCEFAHPNMKGGLGSYAKIRIPDGHVSFGKNPDNIPISPFGLTALHVGLRISVLLFEDFGKTERSFFALINLVPGLYEN